jgi:hypothetical protein
MHISTDQVVMPLAIPTSPLSDARERPAPRPQLQTSSNLPMSSELTVSLIPLSTLDGCVGRLWVECAWGS